MSGPVWLCLCLAFSRCGQAIPNLLLRISISIWAWCVLSQRSLLLTLSIQCIRRILRRQWLTNVWILISLVLFICHVSAPYSNIDFTFVLNKCILVVSPITFDFHTFLNRWKATLALLILFFTSASVPPSVSTMLPRYLKSLTSSSVSPSSMIGVLQVAFILRIFVFLLLIFNPTCAEINASSVVFCPASAYGCKTGVQGHPQSPGHQVGSASSTGFHFVSPWLLFS